MALGAEVQIAEARIPRVNEERGVAQGILQRFAGGKGTETPQIEPGHRCSPSDAGPSPSRYG